jgi:hypothetical protein
MDTSHKQFYNIYLHFYTQRGSVRKQCNYDCNGESFDHTNIHSGIANMRWRFIHLATNLKQQHQRNMVASN